MSANTKKQRPLLATMAKEPFQPVRPYYPIPDRSFVAGELQALEWMVEVPVRLEEAARVARERTAEIREEYDVPRTEREGLASWADGWRQDHTARPHVQPSACSWMAMSSGMTASR